MLTVRVHFNEICAQVMRMYALSITRTHASVSVSNSSTAWMYLYVRTVRCRAIAMR